MQFGFTGTGVGPGIQEAVETFEREICWGKWEQLRTTSAQIDATTIDPTNTPTSILRPGLLLGRIAATGKLVHYDGDATDGSDVAVAALTQPFSMVDVGGTTRELFVNVLIGGPVKAGMLYGLDIQARKQLAGNFLFDDEAANGRFSNYLRQRAKTADYTVTSADDRVLFTTKGASGAVIFTLPAPTLALKGMLVGFFSEANQNMTINCASNDVLVTFNDLEADSVAFSTADQKIGAFVEATPNFDGTKWLIMPRLAGHTMTVST
jgi:hypothetical protein